MSTATRQYGRQSISEEDIAAVTEVLRGNFLTQGPAVERFERALAEKVSARHAIAVTSGTAALHVACLAAGVEPGKRVITQTLSFVASANCARYCGGDVALCDIDPYGLGMSPAALRERIKEDGAPDVLIPVHMAGLPFAAAELAAAAGDALIIEDACHSLGGGYEDGTMVGSGRYSAMSVFSFHPVKPITSGEGGAIVTNDDELARLARLYRSHGIERDEALLVDRKAGFEDGERRPWYYEQRYLGFNYRMTDLQAALAYSQLQRLDSFLSTRRSIAARYDEAFAACPAITLPQYNPADRARSGQHLYIVQIDFPGAGTTRAKFMRELNARNIGSQVHYIPIHQQPYYREYLGAGSESFPVSEAYYAGCLSLPLHPGLNDDDVDYVISTMLEMLSVAA